VCWALSERVSLTSKGLTRRVLPVPLRASERQSAGGRRGDRLDDAAVCGRCRRGPSFRCGSGAGV